jgi:hypothetical protein
MLTKDVFKAGIRKLITEYEDRGFSMSKEKSQQWYAYMINLSDEEFLKKVDLCLSICRKVPFMADVLDSKDPFENTNEKPYWLNAES